MVYVKYVRIGVFPDCILLYKNRVHDFVLIRENTGQRKPEI